MFTAYMFVVCVLLWAHGPPTTTPAGDVFGFLGRLSAFCGITFGVVMLVYFAVQWHHQRRNRMLPSA